MGVSEDYTLIARRSANNTSKSQTNSITINQPTSVWMISSPSSSVTEGGGAITVTISTLDVAATWYITTSGRLSPSSTTGTTVFDGNAGEYLSTISVSATDDSSYQGTTTESITLWSSGYGSGATGQSLSLTVYDNDAAPSPSPSPTPSISITPSPTPSISITPSPSPSMAASPTPTPSPSVTPTPSPSNTPPVTPTPSPTPSNTPPVSPSPTPSPSTIVPSVSFSLVGTPYNIGDSVVATYSSSNADSIEIRRGDAGGTIVYGPTGSTSGTGITIDTVTSGMVPSQNYTIVARRSANNTSTSQTNSASITQPISSWYISSGYSSVTEGSSSIPVTISTMAVSGSWSLQFSGRLTASATSGTTSWSAGAGEYQSVVYVSAINDSSYQGTTSEAVYLYTSGGSYTGNSLGLTVYDNDAAPEPSPTPSPSYVPPASPSPSPSASPAATPTPSPSAKDEQLTASSTSVYTNENFNIYITNGVPNSTFTVSGSASGSGTLDSSGAYTWSNNMLTSPGTFSWTVTFNATGHTRSLTVISSEPPAASPSATPTPTPSSSTETVIGGGGGGGGGGTALS